MRYNVLFLLIFSLSVKAFSEDWVKFYIGENYKINHTLIYNTTSIPQLIPILSDYQAVYNENNHFLQLDLKLNHIIIFSSVDFLVSHFSDQTNTGPGYFDCEIGYEFERLNYYTFSLLGGLNIALTNGQDPYFISRNTANGNFDFFIKAKMDVLMWEKNLFSFTCSVYDPGKTAVEKKYDPADNYHLPPVFYLQMDDHIPLSFGTILVNNHFGFRWGYHQKVFDDYHNQSVSDSDFHELNAFAGEEILLFQNFLVKINADFGTIVYNNNLYPMLDLEFGLGYKIK